MEQDREQDSLSTKDIHRLTKNKNIFTLSCMLCNYSHRNRKAIGELVKGNVFSYLFYYIRVSSYWKLSVILSYQVCKIKYYTLCPARNKQIYIFKNNLNSFNSYSDLKICVKRNTTMIENTDDELLHFRWKATKCKNVTQSSEQSWGLGTRQKRNILTMSDNIPSTRCLNTTKVDVQSMRLKDNTILKDNFHHLETNRQGNEIEI